MRIVRCRGIHPTRGHVHSTRIVTNPKEASKHVAKELGNQLRRLGCENVRWTAVTADNSAAGLDWHLPTQYSFD
jgi:hypothetical protein